MIFMQSLIVSDTVCESFFQQIEKNGNDQNLSWNHLNHLYQTIASAVIY